MARRRTYKKAKKWCQMIGVPEKDLYKCAKELTKDMLQWVRDAGKDKR